MSEIAFFKSGLKAKRANAKPIHRFCFTLGRCLVTEYMHVSFGPFWNSIFGTQYKLLRFIGDCIRNNE